MSDSKTLLASLVGFDTTSRESNLQLIEFVRDYLAGHQVPCELIFNEARSKANLVDGQTWTVPPFQLTERQGKLYGRGAADMKGYIACVLAAVPAFLAAPLRTPVHIALSYDEEVGCLGVRSLLAELANRPHKPVLCIIGEPTELKPVLGHKGKLAMRCDVHGAACHSAYAPQGVNAIEYAAQLIGELGRIGASLRAEDLQDPRFDPPFSTVQTGLISGGKALNIRFRGAHPPRPGRLPRRPATAAVRAGTVTAENARGRCQQPDPVFRAVVLPQPGHRRPRRRRAAARAVLRIERVHHGSIRHRGRPVRRYRHPDRGLWPGQHGPGP
jgi:hypothetical protein